MLRDRIDFEDVSAVKIIEDAALNENAQKVFVRVELLNKEVVNCTFLGDVILQFFPFC